MYDKRDDLDFEIVNFPFLDGDVPRAASYSVYISQLLISILISAQKHRLCGYSLEPPRRRGSNQYPQFYVSSRNMKNIRVFICFFFSVFF